MSLGVLGLDLALRTGWARLERDGTIRAGAERLRRGPAHVESPGLVFLRARKLLRELVGCPCCARGEAHETHAPAVDLVAFEAGSHHRGGAATRLLVGLQAEAQAAAAELALPTLVVSSATLRKHAAGSGRAGKADVVAAARRRWPGLVPAGDDDVADALWVMAWAADEVGAGVKEGG